MKRALYFMKTDPYAIGGTSLIYSGVPTPTKRALNSTKRALYFIKKALHPMIRALYSVQKAFKC